MTRILMAMIMLLAPPLGAEADEDGFPDVAHYLNLGVDCEKQQSPQACEGILDTIETDYAAAIAGDYQGQRNVAYCLQHSCENVMRANPMLACAWRVVILESGHLETNELDLKSYHNACDPLELPARRGALNQAGRILELLAAN